MTDALFNAAAPSAEDDTDLEVASPSGAQADTQRDDQRDTASDVLRQAMVETDHAIPVVDSSAVNAADRTLGTIGVPETQAQAEAKLLRIDTAALPDTNLFRPHVSWLTQLKLAAPRDGVWSLEKRRRVQKRAIDILGASALLAIVAVPMAAVAVAVKLDSRGPVFYHQTRVGLNRRGGRRRFDARRDRRITATAAGKPSGVRHDGGEPRIPGAAEQHRRYTGPERRGTVGYGQTFTLHKFRTMTTDAEKDGVRLSSRGDARITRLGKFLRRTRIDELPQLFNVLKGEMSLVGPRPERPELVQGLVDDIPGFGERTNLLPGLTGLAQVENGYDNQREGFVRKAAYDQLYLQTCCLRNDLKIMLRTVSVVVTGKGAC